MAKEAKLKNSAPLKYHIEVSQRYWEGIFKRERITDVKKQQERVVEPASKKRSKKSEQSDMFDKTSEAECPEQ